MKAYLIIVVTIAFAVLLKVVDYFYERYKTIKMKKSEDAANFQKVNITNEDELKKALDFYKNLAD